MMREVAVTRHYCSEGITDRVLAALRAAKGRDAPVTPENLAAFDHFHGRGLAATRDIAAQLKPAPGERILDIGSGIGGPARWMASQFDVEVCGVDLTPEFCAAAEELNAMTGLAGRVRILAGSALALPVADAAFDAAYSQNVIMNIADKRQFYREAFRAVRPGGRVALSNLCAGPAGEPYFPAPWATTAETSFLETPESMREGLVAAGFEIVAFRDTTPEILETLRRLRERGDDGSTRVAADVIMGERALEMKINSTRTFEEGRCLAIETLARKP